MTLVGEQQKHKFFSNSRWLTVTTLDFSIYFVSVNMTKKTHKNMAGKKAKVNKERSTVTIMEDV